jgi:predicted nucleotidyltransferase
MTDIDTISVALAPFLREYGVVKCALFGSFARGEQTEGSDVDVLVEFAPGTPGLDFFGLKLDIEDALQRSVDLLTFRSLDKAQPEFREFVEREARVIYEQGA